MIDLNKTLEEIKKLCIKVGEYQVENQNFSKMTVDSKSTVNDLVTNVDKESEAMISEFIHKNYPSHSILGEEGGHTDKDSEYTWIIDPLDGTVNYVQELKQFAISIALQHNDETIFGVVYAPRLNHFFYTIKGRGAFLNDEQIYIGSKSDLKDCVIATGFPYNRAETPDNNLNHFCSIMPAVRGVRRFGAAAIDLAYVAAGLFDGYWELSLKPWDIEAGKLLVEEAGGVTESFQGQEVTIIAGNKKIVKQLYEKICKNTGEHLFEE